MAWPWPEDDGFDRLPEDWLRARAGIKWAAAGPGVIPSWVADMDFPPPKVAREALSCLAASGDMGYHPGHPQPEEVEDRWLRRMEARFGWPPPSGRLKVFTDVVQAVEVVLHLATSQGDGVLTLTPAYPVFVAGVAHMGRRLLPVPAKDVGLSWEFDLEAARAAAPEAKVLLLVNPHNPTGRALSRAELGALAQLAVDHDLLVISDEVHADLLLADHARHVPFASLSGEVAERTVTVYSASKSFNMGGMRCGVAHIGPDWLWDELGHLPSHLWGRASLGALVTTLACWSAEGDRWLELCVARLRANRSLLGDWLSGPGGEAGVSGPLAEATYLQWLDFRGAGLGPDPAGHLLGKAHVMLSPGPTYGPGGEGFARLNFATSPKILCEILERIAISLS